MTEEAWESQKSKSDINTKIKIERIIRHKTYTLNDIRMLKQMNET